MFKKGMLKVKKDLAVILSAAMVLSSFSVPTMAAEFDSAEEMVAVEDEAVEEADFEEVQEEVEEAASQSEEVLDEEAELAEETVVSSPEEDVDQEFTTKTLEGVTASTLTYDDFFEVKEGTVDGKNSTTKALIDGVAAKCGYKFEGETYSEGKPNSKAIILKFTEAGDYRIKVWVGYGSGRKVQLSTVNSTGTGGVTFKDKDGNDCIAEATTIGSTDTEVTPTVWDVNISDVSKTYFLRKQGSTSYLYKVTVESLPSGGGSSEKVTGSWDFSSATGNQRITGGKTFQGGSSTEDNYGVYDVPVDYKFGNDVFVEANKMFVDARPSGKFSVTDANTSYAQYNLGTKMYIPTPGAKAGYDVKVSVKSYESDGQYTIQTTVKDQTVQDGVIEATVKAEDYSTKSPDEFKEVGVVVANTGKNDYISKVEISYEGKKENLVSVSADNVTADTITIGTDGKAVVPVTVADGYKISRAYTKTRGGVVTELDVVANGGDGSYTFAVPADLITLALDTKKAYAISKSVSPNGAPEDNVTVDKVKAAEGETVTVTLADKVDEYKAFDVVVKDAGDADVTVTKGENGTWTFKMPAKAVTVTGVFKKINTVSFYDDEKALIDGIVAKVVSDNRLSRTDDNVLAAESYVTAKVIDDGKEFHEWKNKADDSVYDFDAQVKGDLALYATVSAVDLTKKAAYFFVGKGGKSLGVLTTLSTNTVSKNNAKVVAAEKAAKAQETISDNFIGWSTSENAVSANFVFDQKAGTGKHYLYAVFAEKDKFDVTFQVSGNEIEVQKVYDGQKAVEPAKADVDAKVPAGYEFTGKWTVGGVVVSVNSVEITKATIFDAVVTKKSDVVYPITVKMAGKGTGSVSINLTPSADKAYYAKAGATVEFTAKAATGSKLGTVSMNGKVLTAASGKFSFTMPSENAVITATFDKDEQPGGGEEKTVSSGVITKDTNGNGKAKIDFTTFEKVAAVGDGYAVKNGSDFTFPKLFEMKLNDYFKIVLPVDYKSSKLPSIDGKLKAQSKVTNVQFETQGRTQITVVYSNSDGTVESPREAAKAIAPKIYKGGLTDNKLDESKLIATAPESRIKDKSTYTVSADGGIFNVTGGGAGWIYEIDVEILGEDTGEEDPKPETGDFFPGDDDKLKTITGKAVVDFDEEGLVDAITQESDGKTLAKYRTLLADGQIALFPKREQAKDDDIKTTTKIGSTIVSRLNDAGTEMMFPGSTEKHKKAFSAGGGWYLNGSKRVSAAFNFKTAEKAKVKVYWGSNDNSDAYLGLFSAEVLKESDVEANADSLKIDGDSHSGKTEAIISTFEIPEAGEYYLGGYKIGGNGKNVQIYKVEVICDSYVEPEGGDTTSGNNTPSGNKPEGAKSDEQLADDYKALAAAVGNKNANTTLKDVRGAANDQVGFDLTITKGKVKGVSLTSLADGTKGRATINAKVKLGGLSGYTVTTSSNDAKVKKFVDKKAPKAISKGKPLALPAVKTSPVYVLNLKNASKNIDVQLYVVNVSFDKLIKKNGQLTTASVSEDAVSGNRVDITAAKKSYEIKGNTITLGTSPADERFVSGVWFVGKSPVNQMNKPVTVTSGKLTATVIINADGTITAAPKSGKGTLKFTYMLNGRKYKTAVKVK